MQGRLQRVVRQLTQERWGTARAAFRWKVGPRNPHYSGTRTSYRLQSQIEFLKYFPNIELLDDR